MSNLFDSTMVHKPFSLCLFVFFISAFFFVHSADESIKPPTRNVLITAEEEKQRDVEGFLAIKAIHAVLDDDNSGSIDRFESADFLKEDLKFGGSDKIRRENAFHSNDEAITVDDLWENWFQAEERGWTNKQVVEWLTNQVKLPQYANGFLSAEVTGLDLPKMAVQNSSFLSTKIGIKNYVHRQKLQLKALDLVLFGFQDTSSIAKDIALAGLLGLLVAVLVIFKKHKNRSKKQMEELSTVLNKLRDMETDFAGVQNRLEDENLKRQPSSEESENIELLRNQLRELENERRIAEENIFGEGFSYNLQPLLRRTYEMEWAYLYQQKLDCLHEMGEAKEFVDKMRRKQMSFVNSLKLATGATSGTDGIDNKIFAVKARMEKIKIALDECIQRWTEIETICGFSITDPYGMLATSVPLNSLPQTEKSKKLTVVPVPPPPLQNNGTFASSSAAADLPIFEEGTKTRKISELPQSVSTDVDLPNFSLTNGSQTDDCSIANSSNFSNSSHNQKNSKSGAKNRLSKFFRRKISNEFKLMRKSKQKLEAGPSSEVAAVQHVVRLRHIPYGFFEKQIHGYFSQFGDVKRVRVMRNKKGGHNGTAFVEFKEAAVAKIAAPAMDNYLLAENRLRCKVLGQEEVPKCIRKGRCFLKIPKIAEKRVKQAKEQNEQRTPEKEKRRMERFVGELRKRMAKLCEIGIEYEFDFEKKYSDFLTSQNAE
ncbi:hypothetical protein niasHS_006682 [Heterodera schachtii]|uniref:SAM domain-containing protein n=1 Tax=Heterodera schachtii TaxID=97005 RepID=A0ABD2JHZ1_HETSC